MKEKQTARSPLDDERIIELYFERNEAAITETDYKYKKYLYSVAYNILHHKADCEECINDTYLGAWNAMPPARPSALKAFLTVIMRRTSLKRYHLNTKKNNIPSEMTLALSELEDLVSGEGDVEADFDAKRLGEVISRHVSSLTDRRQFIFMSRYYVCDSVDRIAKDLGLSRSMVNKELAAIRAGLRKTLEEEGYSV